MSTDGEAVAFKNPWLELPATPPFVAPCDEDVLRSVGMRHERHQLKLDLLPQPWTGNITTAEVLMLALNPGFTDTDYADLKNPDYGEQWRLALRFETRTPFYFLDPAFAETSGYTWWHRRLRELISSVGIDAVSQKVMCVEHFPYKSISYRPLGVTLPSQRFSFELVRDAMRRRKQIVLMRSERVWLDSVPELAGYPYTRLSNHQNPYLSQAQMTAEQFERLVVALRR
jgi:hypothetical protein